MSGDSYFEKQLARMPSEQTFRVMFGGYEYLRDLPENPGSDTYKLLKKIAVGDPETIIGCYAKMVEEQDEARAVIAGAHGQIFLVDIVKEVEQSIYWPGLVVIGRGAPYEIIQLPKFIEMGFSGMNPVYVSKSSWKDGINGREDEKAVLAFRRSLVTAGNNLHNINSKLLHTHDNTTSKDLAVWDLRQMAEREYFRPYLVAQGLLEAR